jgi:predicted ferric reductase
LILAHVFFSIWGYAQMDRIGIAKETSTMIWGGVYPGMIVATISTALFVALVATSIVIVRRRLDYRAWYAVHFTAYTAIALGWFHQVPTGNELVLDNVAADYWASLYLGTLGVLVFFRLLVPAANAFRYRLRVAEVVPEGPGVVSLRIIGRNLERLHARAGQFFLWRFLSRRGAGGRHTPSRSRPRRTGARSGSPSRAWATSRAGSASSRRARALSPRARSASSPPPCAGESTHC